MKLRECEAEIFNLNEKIKHLEWELERFQDKIDDHHRCILRQQKVNDGHDARFEMLLESLGVEMIHVPEVAAHTVMRPKEEFPPATGFFNSSIPSSDERKEDE